MAWTRTSLLGRKRLSRDLNKAEGSSHQKTWGKPLPAYTYHLRQEKKTTTSKSIFLAQEAKRDRLREGIRAARSTLGMWTLVDLSSDYIWDLRGDQILNEQRNK